MLESPTSRVLAWLLCLFPTVAVASELEVRVAGAPPELARRLVAGTVRAYEEARPWFETELGSPVLVEWVTDDATLRRRGGDPGSVSGLAIPSENRVVLVAGALQRPSRIHGVLVHELCHLLFAAATSGAEVAPPRWLDEGIAMWRSGEWDLGSPWQSTRSDLLADAAAAGSVVPLAELDASFPTGPFFHVAYAQSLAFVEWLVRRDGEEALREWLRRLDQDLDPEPSFAGVYGLPLADAEAAWRRTLERGGWLRLLPSGATLFTLMFVVLGLLVVVKFVRMRLQLRRADEGWEREL